VCACVLVCVRIFFVCVCVRACVGHYGQGNEPGMYTGVCVHGCDCECVVCVYVRVFADACIQVFVWVVVIVSALLVCVCMEMHAYRSLCMWLRFSVRSSRACVYVDACIQEFVFVYLVVSVVRVCVCVCRHMCMLDRHYFNTLLHPVLLYNTQPLYYFEIPNWFATFLVYKTLRFPTLLQTLVLLPTPLHYFSYRHLHS